MVRFGSVPSSDKRRQQCWSWYWGGFLLLWAVAETRADLHYATVYWLEAEKSFQIKDVLDKNGDAYGYYNDTVQSTGWGILEIKAGYGNQPISNEILMYAAGFLEGYLTASRMSDHVANMYPQLIKNVIIEQKVKDFMQKQDEWTREQIKNNKDNPFWRNAGYVIAQLDGLHMGSMEWAKRQKRTPLTKFEISFLNAIGELLDLIPGLSSELGSNDFISMPEVSGMYQWDMGHCSALIKIIPSLQDLY